MLHRRIGQVFITLLLAGVSLLAGCTLHDVYDEVRIVATVPAPTSTDLPHRITRHIKMGEETDRLEEAHIELVKISVLSPDDADLSVFLGIRLYINTGDDRLLLAQSGGIEPGVRSLELEVTYTGDVRDYVEASRLTIEWDVYYRSTGSFPSGGMEIETIIGFNVDVELI